MTVLSLVLVGRLGYRPKIIRSLVHESEFLSLSSIVSSVLDVFWRNLSRDLLLLAVDVDHTNLKSVSSLI